MAYSRPVREAARRYWLLGYSDEKILPLLKADFPDQKTPSRPNTILAWRQADNWFADLEIIAAKAQENRSEEIATELGKMTDRQLGLLHQLDAHVQLMLTRIVKSETGKPIDTQLEAGELSQLASTIDRSIKAQRLIRGVLPPAKTETSLLDQIDMEDLSDEELERLSKGENPKRVLARRGSY